jgi:predicted DNA-binding transcriptional regulator AlpA
MQNVVLSTRNIDDLINDVANKVVEKIELWKIKPPIKQVETDQWFSLPELCNYLPDKPAKATLYGYVSANTIPHHKGPKKLRFLKSEIDSWLKEGRKKTNVEIQAGTDAFVNSRKKKSGGLQK